MPHETTGTPQIVGLWITYSCFVSERILQGDDDSKETKSDGADADAADSMTEEEKMMALMGFGGFNSTKGQQVVDNVAGPAAGGLRKTNKREYRQFMNKRGQISRGPPIPPSM
ncbi:hypothetical protein ACHHYP_20665 [Achlya hypogyna]|uniref:U4/U6.U5 small nuclear ribonucleoprotein 27kDa protein domain-containing protein n=1 Tax=Achlya hypogyna TaxID=1202772 RepID=A0A1V9YFK8_ACHHY|nr:hypothetical protein ACHHYP_20665 [Achlya hypogyna]